MGPKANFKELHLELCLDLILFNAFLNMIVYPRGSKDDLSFIFKYLFIILSQ